MRKIHDLVQGSPEWLIYREDHFNASDAPAMLGESQYKKRDELLREYATGVRAEIDSRTQVIFDQGHAYEADCRPLAEIITGEELFPSIISIEMDGLPLSASLDGWTMDEAIIWEHKTLNKALNAAFDAGEIPLQYRIQMEQQLLISGAEKCLFSASKGTDETHRFDWYESDPALRARIIDGWKQFKIDLENYSPAESPEPELIAAPIAALPAVNYKLNLESGICIVSNLSAFKEAALVLVERSKLPLTTDQDFTDAKQRIKSYKDAESNIDGVIARVMGEMGDADTFVKDLGAIKEFISKARITEDKQVKERNTSLKAELVATAKAAIVEHVEAINKKLGKVKFPHPLPDFSLVIKGKSSFDNMRADLNSAIANTKVEFDGLARIIADNLELIDAVASKHMHLFPDLQQLCAMDSEALRAIALRRIDDAKAAEDKRLADEKAEQERIEAEQKKAAAEKLAQETPAPKELPAVPQCVSYAEYDEMAAVSSPAFEASFNAVFTEADPEEIQEPFVDMSDFIAGKIAAFEQAIRVFEDCVRTGKDFKGAIQNLIAANKLPAKAA